MVTWAVFWVPPVHGAGRFTIVTCPDPDGLQTSGVTVIVDGVGATVAVGGGVAVGVVGVGADASWAATRPDETRGVDAGEGTPAAVTTLAISIRHASTAIPMTGRRGTMPGSRGLVWDRVSSLEPNAVRPN